MVQAKPQGTDCGGMQTAKVVPNGGLQPQPHVLCCGDSLTAGYYGSEEDYCPYGTTLSQKLQAPVDEIGMSGWMSNQMVEHMENEQCVDVFDKEAPGLKVQLEKEQYTVCIIMAGTNDLAHGRTPEMILEDVKILHATCHERGLRTVALPIPGSRYGKSIRRQFNTMLEQWVATIPDKVLFVDMASEVPYSDESGHWCSDGLHMSEDGYRIFGDKLSGHVKEFIISEDPAIID